MEPVSLEFKLIDPDDIILNYQAKGQNIHMLKALHVGVRWATTIQLAGELSVQSLDNARAILIYISIKNVGETRVLLDGVSCLPGSSKIVCLGTDINCVVQGIG